VQCIEEVLFGDADAQMTVLVAVPCGQGGKQLPKEVALLKLDAFCRFGRRSGGFFVIRAG
jgi:hypothetical protein